MPTSSAFVFSHVTSEAAITPPAAPSWVTRATSAKRSLPTPSVEPALKPNQPSQRISTPRPTSGIEWPGITRGLPSPPYLPARGPSKSSAASAPVAPTRCTTVEPAKSCMPLPISLRKPPPKIQCAPSG
jgi:hypothetical protein